MQDPKCPSAWITKIRSVCKWLLEKSQSVGYSRIRYLLPSVYLLYTQLIRHICLSEMSLTMTSYHTWPCSWSHSAVCSRFLWLIFLQHKTLLSLSFMCRFEAFERSGMWFAVGPCVQKQKRDCTVWSGLGRGGGLGTALTQ